MKAMNGKRVLAAVLAAAILLSMAACGKKDEEEEGGSGDGGEKADPAPTLIEAYPFGDQTVPGLTSSETTVAVETVVTYSYTGLSSPGKTVDGYVSFMTRGENGFAVVDKNFVISDEPKYDDEGSVLLAKKAVATAPEKADDGAQAQTPENRLMLLDISWNENGCVIVTREAEGEISQPPEPMTMREAQKYLESLTPAELGLEGESMDEYDVFTFDGTVIVDDRVCVRMNVYSTDSVNHTNRFEGCYLVSLDGRHLYQMNTATQEIVVLR